MSLTGKTIDHVSKDNSKDIDCSSIFINRLENIKNELDESIEFLKKIEENPNIIFIHIKESLGSQRSLTFQCIDYVGKEKTERIVCDLQSYLGNKMNEVFQLWKQKNGIKEKLEIRVRNPNSYTSIYAIYLDDKEIAQFNPFEKFYGNRTGCRSEADILRAAQHEVIWLEDEKKEKISQLENLISVRKKPFSHISTLNDLIPVVFRYKKTMKLLDYLIEKQEKKIIKIQEKIKLEKDKVSKNIESNKKHKQMFEIVERFFLQYDYTLETNESKLY